jgi:hypothetical protein
MKRTLLALMLTSNIAMASTIQSSSDVVDDASVNITFTQQCKVEIELDHETSTNILNVSCDNAKEFFVSGIKEMKPEIARHIKLKD